MSTLSLSGNDVHYDKPDENQHLLPLALASSLIALFSLFVCVSIGRYGRWPSNRYEARIRPGIALTEAELFA